jgi:hypothetical protein
MIGWFANHICETKQIIMTKKTFYHLILDQSGSMQDCLFPTISGFNEQVKLVQSLQERFPEQEITLGLTKFNTDIQIEYTGEKPQNIQPLTSSTYHPSGGTALLDAIGFTVQKLSRKYHHDLLEPGDSAVVVILTDGYENSSKQFSHDHIQSTIKELEATQKWIFSYLGATKDAVEVANSLAIKSENSMSFDISQMNQTYNTLSESMNEYIAGKKGGNLMSTFLKKK